MDIKLSAIYFYEDEIGHTYCETERRITDAETLKRMIGVALRYVNKKKAGCHFTREADGRSVSIVYDNMTDAENGIFNVIYRPAWNVSEPLKMDRRAVVRYIMKAFSEEEQAA